MYQTIPENHGTFPPQLPHDCEAIVSLGRADYDWSLQRPDGGTVDFAQFTGKVVFLYLWENWCTPCHVEIPQIAGLFGHFRGEPGVEFVLVSHQDSGAGGRSMDPGIFALPFYHLTSVLPAAYDGLIMPRTFILDRGGAIVLRQVRPTKWDDPSCVEFIRRLIQK